MSTSEERALVTEIQDRLIELWVERGRGEEGRRSGPSA